MRGRDKQISFEAVVERIAPEVPRFVVYQGKAWNETGTFIVGVSLNGITIGLRSTLECLNRQSRDGDWLAPHFRLRRRMVKKLMRPAGGNT